MADAEPRHLPRLYLLTPALGDAAGFAPLLEAALDGGDVASVLLLLATRDEGEAKKIVKSLAPMIQQRGAALLLADDPQLAARASADGVHIRGSGATLEQALDDAIQRIKPERIVGVGPLSTKHDAMTAAERDLDYLLFGGPFPEARGMTLAGIIERVAWWSEIFTVPCIGYAHRLDDVAALASAGADFIALGEAVWSDPRGSAAAIRDAQAALTFVAREGG
ncbi:MAG TPA: thiamine phosphate synthase [Beijerinckiaceae bacterium]|jgi:thiamine-phosphate pyrophosphorylase|nr:thiamine phosphate synthase [Beijerinckiaceae bacterium]